jgi:hypothetical protein
VRRSRKRSRLAGSWTFGRSSSAASIERNGYDPEQPVLIDQDGYVGDGRHRTAACRLLGVKPVLRACVTRTYVVAGLEAVEIVRVLPRSVTPREPRRVTPMVSGGPAWLAAAGIAFGPATLALWERQRG